MTLIRRNRRRYGGYTIHFGIAVLFIGVAASTAFQHVRTVELHKGQSSSLGRGYVARYDGPTSRIDVTKNGVERLVFGAKLTVFKHGKRVGVLRPERGYYPIEGAPFVGAIGRYFDGESTSEIAMFAGFGRDVWAAVTPDLDPTLLTVKRGDKVFANALGKMSSQEYSTSARSRPSRQRRSKLAMSSSSKALLSESIGTRCCTSAKPSRGAAPTRWVGESGVASSGCASSSFTSSWKSASYSASEISGASSTW